MLIEHAQVRGGLEPAHELNDVHGQGGDDHHALRVRTCACVGLFTKCAHCAE